MNSVLLSYTPLPSTKESSKGKTLLHAEANSFLSDGTPFHKGGKTILTELPPLILLVNCFHSVKNGTDESATFYAQYKTSTHKRKKR